MLVNIQFDENEIDRNTKTILQASTSEETETVKEGYQIIIKTAKQFNEKYIRMMELTSNFQNELKHLIKSWHSFKSNCQKNGQEYKNTTEYDEYLRSRAKIRRENFSTQIQDQILETYKLAMQFQDYLNAALGQLVTTAYVWSGAAKIPETYVIHDMSDFLKADVDRYGNVVVRYRNNARLLRQHAQKIENLIKQDNPHFKYELLKSTYQEIANRFSTYKLSGGRGSYILWLYPYEGQKWNGVLVSSFGSINEAYSTMLLHEHFDPTNVPQDNIEQFMSYVLGVTNLSGTLQGDTTVGQAEIAVKSKGATTLSIEQLFQMAKDIVNLKLNNFNAIQQYLNKKKKENKEAESSINRSLKEILQNIADENIGNIIQGISQN